MHNMIFMVLDFLYVDNANNNDYGGGNIIINNNMFKKTLFLVHSCLCLVNLSI